MKKLVSVILVSFLSVIFLKAALAQGGPPPGGGGGNTTLSGLGCGPEQIARVNSAEEWECSLLLRTTSAIANTARTEAANAHTDARNAQARVGVLEGQNLDPRLSVIEGQDLGNRVTALESQGSDGIQLLRTIVVSPVGPDAISNGQELLAAVQTAQNSLPALSSTNRITILLEPGVYDLGAQRADIPAFVNLRGFDRRGTVISADNIVLVLRGEAALDSLTVVSRNERAVLGGNDLDLRLNDVALEGKWGIVSGATVVATNSEITVQFKCFDRVGNITVENFSCIGSTFFDIFSGEVKVKNSVINGNWTIFNSGGPVVINVTGSQINGPIAPINVNPSPTQNISIDIANSNVSNLTVGFSTLSARVSHSTIASISQSDGSLFVSHSLVGNLNTSGGNGIIATSQIGSPNIIGGTISCPFSYDNSYVLLSGGVC